MRTLARRPAASTLLLLLPLLAALAVATPADANLRSYGEGSTDVDPSVNVSWGVKPLTGNSNDWYWYFENENAGQDLAICYRYQVNGGTFKAPNGNNWAAPASGGTGTLPAAGASICEGPVPVGDDGYAFQSLSGQTSGTRVTYCAKEWTKFSSIGWQESAIPERCQTATYDPGAPTAAVRLTRSGNNVSLTNDPNSVVINIDYSDAVSPPSFRSDTGVNGNNWVCTTTASPCNSGSSFTFSSPCSQGTSALTQTFACTFGDPGSDGTYHACFKVYDGAVLDHLPSNAGLDPLTNPQTFSFTTGNSTVACDSLTVDRTAPDTSLTGGPSEGGTITDPTPSFSFNGSGSPSSFECSMDGGGYSSCSSPHTPGSLGNGPHTFRVRAKDPAGNVDPTPAARSFTVTGAPPPDTTPPDTSIVSGPAEGSGSADTTPTFEFTATEAGTFECSVDGETFAICSSPHTTAVLAAGEHQFRVRARDASDNADASPATRSFRITPGGGGGSDATKPETTITNAPKAKTSSKRARFSFEANEAADFECSLDGEAFASCSSPFSETVGRGKHRFEVRAIDRAGNVDGSPAAHKWKVKKKRRR